MRVNLEARRSGLPHSRPIRLVQAGAGVIPIVVLLLVTCAPALLPPSTPFPTGIVRIVSGADTLRLAVEIARAPEHVAWGLMDRDSLPADAGMLFLHRRPRGPDGAFHMFRTRIPLDIAFLDGAGTILRILEMEPCPSEVAGDCPHYLAGVTHSAALEVNRGYFASRAVAVGDRVLLSDVE